MPRAPAGVLRKTRRHRSVRRPAVIAARRRTGCAPRTDLIRAGSQGTPQPTLPLLSQFYRPDIPTLISTLGANLEHTILGRRIQPLPLNTLTGRPSPSRRAGSVCSILFIRRPRLPLSSGATSRPSRRWTIRVRPPGDAPELRDARGALARRRRWIRASLGTVRTLAQARRSRAQVLHSQAGPSCRYAFWRPVRAGSSSSSRSMVEAKPSFMPMSMAFCRSSAEA